jgi:hypothetical protein
MRNQHEPDPRFVDSLEGQLARELRRKKRVGTSPSVRAMKMGSLIAGSVILGAAAMGFTQQLSESWRRELLEARLELQLQLAQQRVEMQLDALGLTRREVEQGVRSDKDLLYFELRIAEAEADARTRALELEELRQSGREPQGVLSAPLVDGRDFVSEKIKVRMQVARHYLELTQGEVELAREQADVGVVSEDQVQARSLVAQEAEAQLQSLAQQLELRSAYLDDELTAVEVELKMLEAEAQSRVVVLRRQSDYFQNELARYQAQVNSGVMHAAALAELSTRVAEVAGQLRLAMAELEIVQRELQRRSTRR